jgi:hypothetical protein
VRSFLNRFHDEEPAALRPAREAQKSFILPRSSPQQGLDRVLAGMVGQVATLLKRHGAEQKIATIDQEATLIESHKKRAPSPHEGGRGYRPMVALWSETDLVVASAFRDGNAPAKQAPLNCARMAFEALPSGIQQRYFRGDSACHEKELIDWLKNPAREAESGGRIGFCISAVMESALASAVQAVEEKAWKTYATEADGTLRQWAEVPFVPNDPYEQKETKSLRYVGLRLLKARGLLFADGSDRKHDALRRISRSQCNLRLQASAETIARIQKIWKIFDLPTQQATAFS